MKPRLEEKVKILQHFSRLEIGNCCVSSACQVTDSQDFKAPRLTPTTSARASTIPASIAWRAGEGWGGIAEQRGRGEPGWV